jgi:S-(hydroxymethyl)glutathione dehydrogenase/alcohol dehydrogenase
MKAAVFREVNKPMEVEEVQISKPGPREVLVRTVAAGVCHSDMHFFNGTYPGQLPIILGHESAGIVEQVGSAVTYVKPGDHVITACRCFVVREFCLTGHMSLCVEPALRRGKNEEPRLAKNGTKLNQFANLASFADHMLVHEHAIVKIRADMPPIAQRSRCGVTTGVGAINTAKVGPAQRSRSSVAA